MDHLLNLLLSRRLVLCAVNLLLLLHRSPPRTRCAKHRTVELRHVGADGRAGNGLPQVEPNAQERPGPGLRVWG
jgi:hypothetical protein